MELEYYFKNGKTIVQKGIFAIVKAKKPLTDAFAVIQDQNEITVVIDQFKIDNKQTIDIEKNYRILTFDMVLPFGLVGFLAKVSTALAQENISIFVLSAYSTDHILVKEKDLPRVLKKLQVLGFKIKK